MLRYDFENKYERMMVSLFEKRQAMDMPELYSELGELGMNSKETIHRTLEELFMKNILHVGFYTNGKPYVWKSEKKNQFDAYTKLLEIERLCSLG